jgi:hypothetical protein
MPVVSMKLIRRSINAQGRCLVQRAVKSNRTRTQKTSGSATSSLRLPLA